MRGKEYSTLYNLGLKYEIMAHYTYDGGLTYCAKCRDANLLHLEIDHANNDGEEWRAKYCSRAHKQYGTLKRLGYPDDLGLQVLCAKCNSAKHKSNRTINLTVNLGSANFNFAFNWDDPIPDAQPQPLWEEEA